MKKVFTKITILFGFLIFTPQAFAQEEAETPDLAAIVADYLNAWAAINEPDTDLEDLKYYNSFFTPEISYEIPEFDMVFQGEDFLGTEVDSSGRVRNSNYSVVDIIVGKNVVFLKSNHKSERRRSEEDEWQSLTGTEFIVFEFEGDKIKRVFDY